MPRKDRTRRPRRRSALFDIINGLLSLVVLGLLVSAGLALWGVSRFYSEGVVPADTTFIVERGNGLSTVAQRLEDAGLIDNRWIFQAGALAMKKARALKPGEFKLTRNASMADILTELTDGHPVVYSITFPEGLTSWDIVDRLSKEELLKGDIATIPPEGSLLPETYAYERGDKRQSIIDRMTAAEKKTLAEIWANRDPDLPLKTPEELVTLASIVEKETGISTERPQVASVFVNRLRKNMRLQSDPTTIYGITKGVGVLGRGLKQSELETKTDYNTYQMDGLPAGPIANPGADSLKAAANPAKTDYLYFVAAGASPSEGHLFAATYRDHQKNVAKWRSIEQKANQQAAKDAEAARQAMEAAAAAAGGDQSSAGQ